MPRLSDLASHEEIFAAIEAHGVWIPDAAPLTDSQRTRLRALDYRRDDRAFPDEALWNVVSDPASWQPVRIPAADFVDLLKSDRLTPGRLATGLAIAGICLDGHVELQESVLSRPLRLLASRVEGDMLLDFSTLGSLDFRGVDGGRVDARGAVVSGDVSFVGGRSKGGLSFDDADIKGRLKIARCQLIKRSRKDVIERRIVLLRHRGAIALGLRGAMVQDGMLLEEMDAIGAIVMDNADIRSSVVVSEVKIRAVVIRREDAEDVDEIDPTDAESGDGGDNTIIEDQRRGHAFKAMAATVAGSVDFRNSVFDGEVRMLALQTSGSVYFRRVSITGANGRSLLMDFARISGDLRMTGCSIRGCVRMRKAYFSGDLVFGRDDELRGAVDTDEHARGFRVDSQVDESGRPLRFDAMGRIKGFAIRLSGATIEGDFRVFGTTATPAQVSGTMDLTHLTVGRKIRLEACHVRRRLNSHAIAGQFMTVGGDVRWAGVTIVGVADLQDTKVGGNLEMVPHRNEASLAVRRFQANGAGRESLLMRRIRVGGDFRLDGRDEDGDPRARFSAYGPIILTAAKIGGELTLAEGLCTVTGSAGAEPVSDDEGRTRSIPWRRRTIRASPSACGQRPSNGACSSSAPSGPLARSGWSTPR